MTPEHEEAFRVGEAVRLAEPLFTDREWAEAKMFGQYEQRDEGEVVIFRRIDLCAYTTMLRQYDAELRKCACHPDENPPLTAALETAEAKEATLAQECKELRAQMQEMVLMAARKHRPAYDEQQRIIMELRARIAELEQQVPKCKSPQRSSTR